MRANSSASRTIGSFTTLDIQARGPVALVTIDRADARNALSLELQSELRETLEVLRRDQEVGAVVFTGAGKRAFAAGADINGLRDYNRATAFTSGLQRLFDEIESFEKPPSRPSTASLSEGAASWPWRAICGWRARARGSDSPRPRSASSPGAGGTQRLTRLAGVGMALDLVLTGRLLSAEEALRAGLVSRMVPDDALLDTCREIAEAILARGPLAVRLARMVVRAGADVDLTSGQLVERLAQAVLYETDDKREGVAAFLDKRPARFNRR